MATYSATHQDGRLPGGAIVSKGTKRARAHRTTQNVTPPAGEPSAAKRAAARKAAEADVLRERLGLDDFDEVDRRMLQALLIAPGIRDHELGALVGLTRETANRRKNRPTFQRALEASQLDALTVINRNMAKAAHKLGELVTNADPAVALRASLAHVGPMIKAKVDAGQTGAEVFASFLDDAYKVYKAKRGDAPAAEPAPASGVVR